MPSPSITYTLNTGTKFITPPDLCIYSFQRTLIAVNLKVGWK